MDSMHKQRRIVNALHNILLKLLSELMDELRHEDLTFFGTPARAGMVWKLFFERVRRHARSYVLQLGSLTVFVTFVIDFDLQHTLKNVFHGQETDALDFRMLYEGSLRGRKQG